jgi:hypothetical protein
MKKEKSGKGGYEFRVDEIFFGSLCKSRSHLPFWCRI